MSPIIEPMPRSKRKRASRVQTDAQDEDSALGVASVPPEDDEGIELDSERPEYKEESVETNRRPEVEAELWDSFREEFHEAVEQLPLYLHRTYALLRELDEQVTARHNEILPSFQKYIRLRRSLARRQDTKPLDEQGHPLELDDQQLPDTNSDVKPEITDEINETTRGHLRHVGWLIEEVLRGSQEKVGLAQAAYDSVDRHIRQLDQSIREQEMSISFGLRQGTHPSLLPDLAAPSRWARPTRVTHSPIPGLSDDEEVTAPKISVSSEVTIGMATGSDAPRGPPSKKSKKGKKRKLEKAVSETEVAPATVTFSSRSLRLKVPPLKATDPDEPKYCYCNNISFGDMVACDYPHCKLEWFHLDCVGLTEAPQSRTWYCRDCEPLVRKTENGSTRKRGR